MKNTALTKRLLFWAAAVYILPGSQTFAEKSYISIHGTFDFDKDGFSEFLSLEKSDPMDMFPTIAAYYEIDDMGEHTQLWNYHSSVSIVGVGISDVDGDNAPEITIAENFILYEPHRNYSLVHVFPWSGKNFSSSPTIFWSPHSEKLPSHPTGLAIIDLDNNGWDEVAVALGSPVREIRLLGLNNSVDPPALRITAILKSEQLSSGYGKIVLSIADKNQDGFMDLVAVSQETEKLITEVFENVGSNFSKQMPYKILVPSLLKSRTTLNTYAVTSSDINQDGQLDVVLPFNNGSASALNLAADTVNLFPLDAAKAELFHVSSTSLSDADINEILLARAELGIGGMKVRKLKLETIKAKNVMGGMEPDMTGRVRQLELKPVDEKQTNKISLTSKDDNLEEAIDIPKTIEPAEPGSVGIVKLTPVYKKESEDTLTQKEDLDIADSIVTTEGSEEADLKRIRQLELASLDRSTEKEALPDKEENIKSKTPEESIDATEDKTPGITRRVQRVKLKSLTKGGEIPSVSTITLPPGATISDTLFFGGEFSIPLDQEKGKKFHAFRPRILPKGATFDPTSLSIIWTPERSQAGLHKIAYDVEYELIGDRVKISETEEELQVITKTESLYKEIYIYIKSPSEEENNQ